MFNDEGQPFFVGQNLLILDFKVKKPVLWKFIAMGAAVLAPLLILLLRCPG